MQYFINKVPPSGNIGKCLGFKLCMPVGFHIGYKFAIGSHSKISIVYEVLREMQYFENEVPPSGNMGKPLPLELCTLVDLRMGYNFPIQSYIEICLLKKLTGKPSKL